MYCKPILPSSFPLSLILVLISGFSGFGQIKQPDLVSSYKAYTELPREIGYAHLNKTTYLKGEIIGYTAYIFDKASHKLSSTATNVYCTISDENNTTIKSEMILANNSVANGSFQIDSLFTSGKYTFRAYTNWMRNFEEPNFYGQILNILDSEAKDTQKSIDSTSKLDAQFLPEGGHFVADVKNSVGVIVKDSFGFGVPNLTGHVVDSENNILNNFTTNSLGIGKFTFKPNSTELYKVILNFNNTEHIFNLKKAADRGIALTINGLENRVAISLRTNENTSKQIGKQNYTLAIHNGKVLKTININFKKSLEVMKTINFEDLSTGINIFTLFDEQNKPILERLFFKYEGIRLLNAQPPQIENSIDSLTIKIPLNNINDTLINNFSVSILPGNTKSYNPNNNIISSIYLQPYINSYIENAAYYFTDISRKKKFELDNVLLTQGWSSYDWNTIFNNPPKANYEYENGVSFKANANDRNISKYIMYATRNNDLQVFEIDPKTKDFQATGLLPMDNEKLRFSAIKNNNATVKPNLYVQFSPFQIPTLGYQGNFAPIKEKLNTINNETPPMYRPGWEKVEDLDEVTLTVNKEAERTDRLKRVAFGKVDVFDDLKRTTSIDFASYLRTQGYKVTEYIGELQIINTRGKSPIVYLDNIRLYNTDALYKFPMDNVDYISINKLGGGEGGEAANGVIKIFTDPTISQNKLKRNVTQEVPVPLTFSSPKEFYVPEYTSYQSQFYQDYGVIGWFPRLRIQEDSNLIFKIPMPKVETISIFIEGTANDGSFIFEVKNISVQ